MILLLHSSKPINIPNNMQSGWCRPIFFRSLPREWFDWFGVFHMFWPFSGEQDTVSGWTVIDDCTDDFSPATTRVPYAYSTEFHHASYKWIARTYINSEVETQYLSLCVWFSHLEILSSDREACASQTKADTTGSVEKEHFSEKHYGFYVPMQPKHIFLAARQPCSVLQKCIVLKFFPNYAVKANAVWIGFRGNILCECKPIFLYCTSVT